MKSNNKDNTAAHHLHVFQVLVHVYILHFINIESNAQNLSSSEYMQTNLLMPIK